MKYLYLLSAVTPVQRMSRLVSCNEYLFVTTVLEPDGKGNCDIVMMTVF